MTGDKICLLFAVLCVAALFFLGADMQYGQAHFEFGLHGRFIKGLYSDITGTRGVWYEGYETVERSFILTGVLIGLAIGIIAFIFPLAAYFSKKEQLQQCLEARRSKS